MATRRAKIKKETMFPFQVHTWDVALEGKYIIVRSYSRAEGKDKYIFPFKEGTLNFYNGNDSKYCYFRDQKFQEFLTRYNLSGVKKEDPNNIFYTKSHRSGYGSRKFKLATDGKVSQERLGGAFDGMTDVGNACCSSDYANNITGATWTILYTYIDYKDNHSQSTILYTKKKVENLKIPLPIPWWREEEEKKKRKGRIIP